uniref:C2H2-type domain-containing protein n=1 Tax=Kalanchoe fedtschenkoi TaxID=63787 RepID=A0A7N0UTB8_KALFE
MSTNMQRMLSASDGGTCFPIPSHSIRGFPPTLLENDPNQNPKLDPNPVSNKKKRNLPGTPDPDAEVIALSPKSLMATNRFICEICKKGFQRDQNLQLHRRGHNLPWKLKQRNNKEIPKKKVYICPEKTCVHHDPSRALGDLTGIKKHFSRKHGEKKWKCDKCSKKYAVQSDWKAHSKTCGTREYKCDCGTLFSRKDSFITHRAFCDALTEENARFAAKAASNNLSFRNDTLPSDPNNIPHSHNLQQLHLPAGFVISSAGYPNQDFSSISQFDSVFRPDNFSGMSDQMFAMGCSGLFGSSFMPDFGQLPTSTIASLSLSSSSIMSQTLMKPPELLRSNSDVNRTHTNMLVGTSVAGTSLYSSDPNSTKPSHHSAAMSATALLQKAAQMGSTRSTTTAANNTFLSKNNAIPDATTIPAPISSSSTSSRPSNISVNSLRPDNLRNGLTRDFLGISNGEAPAGGSSNPFSPHQPADKFAASTVATGFSSQLTGGNH